jgi:hypothetical protein
MYDKYQTGNTFVTGATQFAKHKGFLFSTSTTSGATFYFINDQGNTFSMGLTFPAGVTILPVGAYSIVSMAAGLTGLRLN